MRAMMTHHSPQAPCADFVGNPFHLPSLYCAVWHRREGCIPDLLLS